MRLFLREKINDRNAQDCISSDMTENTAKEGIFSSVIVVINVVLVTHFLSVSFIIDFSIDCMSVWSKV
jgi:hypothetical protein